MSPDAHTASHRAPSTSPPVPAYHSDQCSQSRHRSPCPVSTSPSRANWSTHPALQNKASGRCSKPTKVSPASCQNSRPASLSCPSHPQTQHPAVAADSNAAKPQPFATPAATDRPYSRRSLYPHSLRPAQTERRSTARSQVPPSPANPFALSASVSCRLFSILNPVRLSITSLEQAQLCSQPGPCRSSASVRELRSSPTHIQYARTPTSTELESLASRHLALHLPSQPPAHSPANRGARQSPSHERSGSELNPAPKPNCCSYSAEDLR